MEPQENVSAASVQQPTIEEKNFPGALFGFKRREVLAYVRSMSEQNESVVRQLDDSIRSLNGELENSRQKTVTLQEQITALQKALEDGQAADAEKQQQLEEALREYHACKEELSGREEGYQQLQQEYADLREQKEQADSRIRETEELLKDSKRRLAEETAKWDAREQQMKQQFAARMKSAAKDAQSRLQMAGLDACRREAALRQDAEEEKNRIEQNAEATLQSFSSKATEEQERLANHVEQVDAQLNGLKREMEQVQQQIWAAHAMIRQTTQEMNDLLEQAKEKGGFRLSGSVQPAAEDRHSENTSSPEKVEKAVPPKEQPPAPRPAVKKAAGEEKAQSDRPAAPRQAASQRVHPTHSTVRSARETVSDYLLDALGRLWEKK